MKKENPMVEIPTNPNIMRFEVTLKNGKVLRVQTERYKSGAFEYGNKTAVGVYVNEELYKSFDTRYDEEMNTVEGYRKFFAYWVEENWSNPEKVEKIEQIL